MDGTASSWISIEKDVESVSWSGDRITLSNISVEKNKETGKVRVPLKEIIKAEQKFLAKEYKIEPNQVYELLLLYAQGPRFTEPGYINDKSKFNKMLFYIWKRLESEGFGDSFIFDKFGGGRAGPVPINLADDLVEFSEKGIVEISAIKNNKKIGKGIDVLKMRQPGVSKEIKLTDSGKKLAESLWYDTPTVVREVINNTKQDLFLLSTEQIKKKVHSDYPEYKRTYVVNDTE